MKKHFYLVSSFLLFAIFSQAQIRAGQILLGGNVGFAHAKVTPVNPSYTTPTNQTNISLSPSFGRAVKDNMVVGFDLNYFYGNNEQFMDQSQPVQTYIVKTRTYGAGFFLRRYKTLGSGFSLFMQGRLGFNYTTENNDYPNPSGSDLKTRRYDISLGFYPGVSYGISPRVQLETGFQNLVYVQYNHQEQDFLQPPGGVYTTYRSSSFSLGTGLSNSLAGFVVGFRVLLGS